MPNITWESFIFDPYKAQAGGGKIGSYKLATRSAKTLVLAYPNDTTILLPTFVDVDFAIITANNAGNTYIINQQIWGYDQVLIIDNTGTSGAVGSIF